MGAVGVIEVAVADDQALGASSPFFSCKNPWILGLEIPSPFICPLFDEPVLLAGA